MNQGMQKASRNSLENEGVINNNPSQYLRSKIFSSHTLLPP
jgi:hypothetical protein